MNSLLLILLLAAVNPLLHAQSKSARSGPWSTPGTWSGGAIPKDTVVIGDGHTITVQDTRAIGTSGAAGSVAIRLSGSGKIVIAAGGNLLVRGDTVYAGGLGNRHDVLIVQGGGTWTFDSSQAPRGTRYHFHPDGDAGVRPVRLNGTAAARAVLTSAPGGSPGSFTLSKPIGGMFKFAYGDISRIGDTSTAAFQVGYEYSGGHMVSWDVTDTRFRECGAIQSLTHVGVDDDGIFRHNRNVHERTAGPAVFAGWINISQKYKGGAREIRNNVFDVSLSRTQFYLPGFTVWGNYFGDSTITGGFAAWTTLRGNFMRYGSDWWPSSASATALTGDVKETYIFVDSDWGNPKPMISAPAVKGDLLGVIYGQAGTAMGPPGVKDSGELFFNTSPPAPTQYAVRGSIILPNMAGYGSLEIGAWGVFPNMLGVVEHNTWFGGYPGTAKDGTNGNFGFPALQMAEGYKPVPGQIVSFKSNILWNPQLPGKTAGFAKLADMANGWNDPDPTTDICAPQACDHNTGWGHTLVNAKARQYTNQGKGYVAKFSRAPGAHDVDADPKFVDYQRSVELFDSAYLGNKATPWTAQRTYKLGEFAQWSRPDVYWNLPVNYRYVNAPGCGGTNPEPGKGPKWRECWEWASLYRLREAIASGRKFDDQTIGVHGEDVIMTLIAWIRAGYSPTNSQLAGAAHDGSDIGAVPVTFPAPRTK